MFRGPANVDQSDGSSWARSVESRFQKILARVTTADIVDRAVTAAKIALGSITGSHLASSTITFDKLAVMPGCRVYNSANQSLTSNTEASVSFSAERYDNDNMWVIGSPTRVTFTTAGIYSVSFMGVVEADNDYNFLYAYLRVNGTTIIAIDVAGALTDAGVSPSLNPTTIYRFAAADYVEVRIVQKNTSAGAHNLASLANYSPELAVVYLSA